MLFYHKKSSFFMNANAKYILTTSQNILYLYSRETGQLIRKLGKGQFDTPNYAGFLDEEHLLIRTLFANYYLYSLLENRLQRLFRFRKMGAEGSEPVICSKDRFIEYCYSFPDGIITDKQELFLADIHSEPALQSLDIQDPMLEDGVVEKLSREGNELWVMEQYAVYCYSLETGEFLRRVPSKMEASLFNCYRDGDEIMGVFVSKNGFPYIQSINSSKRILCEREPFEDNGDGLIKICLSRNRKFMAAIYFSKTVVYSLETGEKIYEFTARYNHFADFCDDDTSLLLGTWEDGRMVSFLK